MKNSFINYLNESYRRFMWESAREKNGVEVPWLADMYREWMKTKDGKTSSVANVYVHYLRALDREILAQLNDEVEAESEIVITGVYSKDKDFFYVLKNLLISNSLDEVEDWFDTYLKLIDEELEYAKKGESNISSKNVSDWRSAFKNYKKFFVEWFIPTMQSKMNRDDAEQKCADVVSLDKDLHREMDFLEWMQEYEGMGTRSAQSYVSNIKRANREVFSKHKEGVNVLADIAELLRNGKEAQVNKVLIALEEKLTHGINIKDESVMSIPELFNCRSAFRKYVRFIQEEVMEGTVDEEELVKQADEEGVVVESSLDTAIYEYDDLEANFRFRLITQNRFGEILYPISLLKRLFNLSQKASILQSSNNGNSKWFNRWLDDCIAKIIVHTDKGDYTLADIDELEIEPRSKNVTVMLPGRQKVTVWTETETGERVPMQVDKLEKIHIDHTPLISRVLTDNAKRLPALIRLTEIIRECARRTNVVVDRKSLSVITHEMFHDSKIFLELEEMIPALQDELNLICEETTLKLMAAEYNLKKKE